jgi:hypothetical protein
MAPRKNAQGPPADPVVFGPPMEPEQGPQNGPQPPAAQPQRQRRRKGPIEQAVAHDLAPLPEYLRKGGVAAAALRLATELDMGVVMGRDAAGHAREIRQCLTVLREWAPGAAADDKTDEARGRRERRLELVPRG